VVKKRTSRLHRADYILQSITEAKDGRGTRVSELASSCALLSARSSLFPYTPRRPHPRKCMKTRVALRRADYLVGGEFNITRPWLEARNEKHWKERALFGRQFNSLPRLWNWGPKSRITK
jgi:hypothetical protein